MMEEAKSYRRLIQSLFFLNLREVSLHMAKRDRKEAGRTPGIR